MSAKTWMSLLYSLMILALTLPLSALENAHVKGGLITPHLDWERPADGAPHKVLFFIYYNCGMGRYPAELAERYNIDHETAYLSSSGDKQDFLGKEEGASRAEMLIRRGDWDAFVFWGCTPTSLLNKYQKAYMLILQQVVRKGAGLVMVDADDDPRILKPKNLLPKPATLTYDDGTTSAYYKVGKGKGVKLNNFDYPSIMKPYFNYKRHWALQYNESWKDGFEMRLGNVYSAMRWAMNRPLPPSAIRETQNGLALTAPATGKLTWTILGMGDSFHLASRPVRKDETVTVTLPDLAPGSYLSTAIIRKDGKVQAFTARRHQRQRPTDTRITSLKLPKNYGIPGKDIKGQVSLKGQGTLILRLRDPKRRILLQMMPKILNGKADFSFQIADWMPYLITVEAELVSDGRILDRTYVYCHRTIQRKNRFDVMAWGFNHFCAGGILANKYAEEAGFNELVGDAPETSPQGLLYMPPKGGPLRISKPRDDKACWLSPQNISKREAYLPKAIAKTQHRGMKRLLIGDEGPVQLGCLADSCQKEYRKFLQDKYQDLNKLNQAWKTNFNAWEQVGLSMIPEKNGGRDLARYGKQIYVTPDCSTRNHAINTWGIGRPRDWNQLITIFANDPKSREYYKEQFLLQECGSMLAGNYTRWFDRCDFRSYAMAKTLKQFGNLLEKHYPGTTGGLSGTMWLGVATDFDRFFGEQNATLAITYSNYRNNPITELIDALVPTTYCGNHWSGYAKTPQPMLAEIWFDVLSHPAMLSIYSVFSSPPAYWGTLRPDLSVNPPMKAVLDSLLPIRNGLGDTLMRSRKRHDPVVILWSWPSVWASRIRGGETFELNESSYSKLLRHLNDLGIRYRFMTAKQLENGKTSLRECRTLFLPRIDAMSDRLADMIRQFAKTGGTVIADVRPAVFGPNLETLDAGKLDREFGIRRSAPGNALSDTLNMKGVGASKFHLDRTVSLDGATARYKSPKQIPAFIQNPYGKGRFILMNFPFYQLPSLQDKAFLDGSAPDFLALTQDIKPFATYAVADGSRYYGVRNVTFRNGDMTVLFAQHPAENGKHVNVIATLRGQPQVVLDVNAHKTHGAVSSFAFTLPVPAPACFILSPQPLPDLKVSIPPAITRGQLIQISYQVDGNMKGRRPAVLTMTHNGRCVEDFRHIIMAQPQAATINYKVALNQLPGTYVFQLQDTLTGKTSQATYKLP